MKRRFKLPNGRGRGTRVFLSLNQFLYLQSYVENQVPDDYRNIGYEDVFLNKQELLNLFEKFTDDIRASALKDEVDERDERRKKEAEEERIAQQKQHAESE